MLWALNTLAVVPLHSLFVSHSLWAHKWVHVSHLPPNTRIIELRFEEPSMCAMEAMPVVISRQHFEYVLNPWSICIWIFMCSFFKWGILSSFLSVPALFFKRASEHPLSGRGESFYSKHYPLRVYFPAGLMVHWQLVRSLCAVIYYSLAHLAVQL